MLHQRHLKTPHRVDFQLLEVIFSAMKSASCAIGLLVAGLGIQAQAELALDVKAVEVKAKPEDESVTAVFTFRNKGAKPVKVLGLESACSCLSAELDRAVYEPGGVGQGKAEFKVTSFTGRHEKTVTVQTDDPDQPEWVVQFVLEVPEVVAIEPKSLQWWLNEEPVEKQCVVKMVGDDPIKIVNITATRENVKFSWKEIKPGREYLVRVQPTTTADVMLGALKIETDSKIAKYQRQLAFFSVYRKPEHQVTGGTAAKPLISGKR